MSHTLPESEGRFLSLDFIRSGAGHSSAASQSWLTTFGDLLTLMLCFASLAASQGIRGEVKSAQNSEAVRGVTQMAPPAEDGTSIAEAKQVGNGNASGLFVVEQLEGGGAELLVGPEHIDPRAGELWSISLESLVNQLDQLLQRPLQVELVVELEGDLKGSKAQVARRIALGLHRQLADTYGKEAVTVKIDGFDQGRSLKGDRGIRVIAFSRLDKDGRGKEN